MTISYHERPGVYSDFEASAVYAGTLSGKTVGLAAQSGAEAGLYTVTSGADAARFAGDAVLYPMLHLLLQNGVGKVLVYALESATVEAYTEAIRAILAKKEARILLTDSDSAQVADVLKTAVETASKERNECIAVVGVAEQNDAARIAFAGAINSPRVIVTAPESYRSSGSGDKSAAYSAAALAGLIAAQTDPALPLGGARLAGLEAVDTAWTESAMDLLIRGGITPLEYVDGGVSVVRGVTSKTTESGASDPTWKEITTILTVDDVITGIRSALQAKFRRAKNNAATRSAIRDQVVIELEGRLRRQIIDFYDGLSVAANADDPTACDVIFSFGVTHGLSHILLTAHITV